LEEFRKALSSKRLLLFDGGMGTLLQERGMVPGQSPELYGLARPEIIRACHREYLHAGAMVLTTNTFGGTALKLGAGVDVQGFNRTMAGLAREVAGDNGWVAGSVGPCGRMIEPLGDLTFHDLVTLFEEQIAGLVQGGVDLILAETHFDLSEAKAVVVAARNVCDLPVGVCMTFESGLSLTGSPPLTFMDTMQNMSVEMVGTNCGAGPEGLREIIDALLPRAETPLLVQPNAGLPLLDGGRTVFPLDPLGFAGQMERFIELGVKGLGGCCGTTPDHIRALSGMIDSLSWTPPAEPGRSGCILTSRTVSVPIGKGYPLAIVGERINPTGKPVLAAELQEGKLKEALRLAEAQVHAGAKVLDVNVGAPMVDEETTLPALVRALASRVQTPLCLDSSSCPALRKAIAAAPGSPLVNSISGEEGRLDELGPDCRRFGTPFILLPLQGKKLPVTAKERIAIIEELLDKAFELQIPKRLLVIDALALTVSSKPQAGLSCLEVIRHCTEQWQVPTIIGLSNISFGLPARELVSTTFLAMAMGAGLSACIANPNSSRLAEIQSSAEVLLNRDPQADRFIEKFRTWTGTESGTNPAKSSDPSADSSDPHSIHEAVLKGRKEEIVSLLEEKLRQGISPVGLVNQEMIPAITEVGNRYERKEYFLPQLLLSAETMQLGFERLRPLLEQDSSNRMATVIMATVEGDIHDIGKNIVCLMLRNHGFHVVDLGKDVSAESIAAAALEHGAELVGLSALMTTTMTRMEAVVALFKERCIPAKIMVGGAVLTRKYAERIGADGYAGDAIGAVKLAQRLIETVTPETAGQGIGKKCVS
jgi:5-methyltetrahydrofolate--homocysteine methyltransferase